jgi:nitric oxide reductase large subunit
MKLGFMKPFMKTQDGFLCLWGSWALNAGLVNTVFQELLCSGTVQVEEQDTFTGTHTLSHIHMHAHTRELSPILISFYFNEHIETDLEYLH